MDYIIITLRVNKEMVLDLKIPTFLTIFELITMFEESLHISIGKEAKIQAEPIGRILDSTKTLNEEGVLNGAILTLI